MQHGREGFVMHRIHVFAVACIVLTLAAIPSYSAQTFRITDLGTLGGTYSQANGINDSRQIAGQSAIAAKNTHAFLYDSGTMQDLGAFGDTQSVALAINGSTQIA